MSLNRFAKQRDSNEPAIVAALRSVGATVYLLDRPVDLLVGYRGRTRLLEVKLPLGAEGGSSHSRPNNSQRDFIKSWRGGVSVVRSPLEALEAIGAKTKPIASTLAASDGSKAL